ncbi:MAG: hypothetical protein ACRD51_05760, partial [Candidatus Acidiferrum sp.]
VLEAPSRTPLTHSRAGENGGVAAIGGMEGNLAALPTDASGGVVGEVQQAVLLKKQLTNKVKEDPESASRVIQNWIRESEGSQ